MELKDFVKETLLQITQGIKEAQEATEEYGSVINPSSYNSERTIIMPLLKTRNILYRMSNLKLPSLLLQKKVTNQE